MTGADQKRVRKALVAFGGGAQQAWNALHSIELILDDAAVGPELTALLALRPGFEAQLALLARVRHELDAEAP